MNLRLKWMLAVAVVVVFAAGTMTGTLLGTRFYKAQRKKHVVMMRGHHGPVGERLREHFRAELELTPEQSEKVMPIIDATSEKLQAIRSDTAARVRETMEQADREMSPHLSAEQQKKLRELHDRHERHLRKRRFRGRPPESEPSKPKRPPN